MTAKLKHSNFRANAVPNAPTKPDALVNVKVGIAMTIQTGCESTRSFAERQGSDAGPINLPTVRVARQHNITSVPLNPFDRLRIVRQQDSWRRIV